MTGFIGFVVLLFIYFIPSLIAGSKGIKNFGLLVFLNIIFGFTIIGWIAVLCWSSVAKSKKEIERDEEVYKVLMNKKG